MDVKRQAIESKNNIDIATKYLTNISTQATNEQKKFIADQAKQAKQDIDLAAKNTHDGVKYTTDTEGKNLFKISVKHSDSKNEIKDVEQKMTGFSWNNMVIINENVMMEFFARTNSNIIIYGDLFFNLINLFCYFLFLCIRKCRIDNNWLRNNLHCAYLKCRIW